MRNKIIILLIIVGLLGIGGWYLLQQQVQKPQSIEGTSEIIKSATTSTEAVTEPEVSVETQEQIVSVKTDKQTYGKGEEIIVTVMNNSDSQITTFDLQTSCTVVTLEKQNGTEWNPVVNCFVGRPSQYITYAPHSEEVVTISTLFSGPWEVGIYRASILFSKGTTFNFGESFTIYSQSFDVL